MAPSPPEEAPGRWVVCGLGNPGERYARTRHNAGAMVVERLAGRAGARLRSHRSGCLAAEVKLAGTTVTLARPTAYMNESGRQVAALVRYYGLDPQNLVVIHDEIDLPFGVVRVKVGGGTAGHNGLRSVVSHLSSRDFVRVRVGVGRPRGDAADYVLDAFSASERARLDEVLDDAAEAVELVVGQGPQAAMNVVNARDRAREP